MGQWNIAERRQYVRYEVELSVIAQKPFGNSTITAASHDISEKGIGLVLDHMLAQGDIIDICVVMPDNNEQIKAQGKIVWVNDIGPGRFRVGVLLQSGQFKPIPMVLRSIKARTSRYYG